MASPEAALYAALTADAGVSALVASRVFPKGGRQGVDYPYITYQRISTQGAAHLTGASDLDWPRFQLDVWGHSFATARAVADAMRTALDAVEHTAAGLTFTATIQDERSDFDGETGKCRISQDYFIWHSR